MNALVLKDPHQRAIYDCVGVKGLKTEGWEIVHRTKTPQEIREEYEALARYIKNLILKYINQIILIFFL